MHKLSEFIEDLSSKSTDSRVKDVSKLISRFYANFEELPEQLPWQYRTVEDFAKYFESKKGTKEQNMVFFKDMMESIYVYGYVSVLKTNELLNSAIEGLNAGNYVPAAVCARSMLEMACTMVYYANSFQNDLVDINDAYKRNIGMSEAMLKLEKEVVTAFWGDGNRDSELRQVGVAGVIGRISRQFDGDVPYKIYSLLCNIAHPSILGHTRFISNNDKKDDSNILVFKKTKQNDNHDTALTVLWAVSFSLDLVLAKYPQIVMIVDAIDKASEQYKKDN